MRLLGTCAARRSFDALFFRAQLDKRTLLENLDFVLLAIDELCDDGFVGAPLVALVVLTFAAVHSILLESDAAQLAQRVSMKSECEKSCFVLLLVVCCCCLLLLGVFCVVS